MMYDPALTLIEFSSIAAGIQAADAMVKRAPIDVIQAGTVHPGKYLVLVGGLTADVEESLAAGREVGRDAILDFVYLPQVHPSVVTALRGGRSPEPAEALGVLETSSVAAAIRAADAGVKGAQVELVEVRLADGLGGKGIVLYSGVVADVEIAVALGVESLQGPDALIRQVVIPQLHEEMWDNLSQATRFSARVTA
ncbi:MAG: BMC domain-containing protein [Chloroflexi bacterium]|nr:BMC domain-containing protein [Chloroflexota bacterium]MDK1045697.1 BMC domain-containing protein [Anaerolineales bacterium]MCH8093374.1 BMC domain-containing protein [Chloroflexota bacterium]MCH8339205.1 BMC domain-containing protein [Chloroflexota bacterium]MCH8341675.1 BMC domain-containing protein [Chloroflexota bacterium]